MCYCSILPTAIDSKNLNDSLVQLSYVLNRWLKMLVKYGKLDSDSWNKDFNVISRALKSKSIDNKIKVAVQSCRNQALMEKKPYVKLHSLLESTLSMICSALENDDLLMVKSIHEDQGMTKRYKPLSKKLAKEKIHRLDREIIYTDSNSDDSTTTRLVRRIVEKRAAQMVAGFYKKGRRGTSSFRQSVRRAVSFSLYNASFTDYDAKKRASGTHWRVDFCHRGKLKRLKAKRSYKTREEAMEAYNKYHLLHPEDLRPISVYRCDHCGKWHIGHTYLSLDSVELDAPEMNKAS